MPEKVINRIVFYSWQSDLPPETNKEFIQEALNNVLKRIYDDPKTEAKPVADRDTLNVPGSPDIVQTLFGKINKEDAIVSDVSIVAQYPKQSTSDVVRSTPNPNVIFELGYAFGLLGEQRIVMVMNTAFGSPEALPADFRGKRIETYELRDGSDHAVIREELEAKLEARLREILEMPAMQLPELSLKLVKPGDLTTFEELVLPKSKTIHEHPWHEFGFVLENRSLKSAAREITITVDVYGLHLPNDTKPPLFDIPNDNGWEVILNRINPQTNQPARLSLKQPFQISHSKNEHRWNGFRMKLDTDQNSEVALHYKIVSGTPSAETHGQLKIALR